MTQRRRPRRVGFSSPNKSTDVGRTKSDRVQDIPGIITTNVSRETLSKLKIYVELLLKWNRTINLVSSATLDHVWTRHIADSAQIFDICQSNRDGPLIDLGSGAGFPGLVLAIMGREHVHLLEADQRKCTFLRTVARETNTPVIIHNTRLENFEVAQPFAVITARGFASLNKILAQTQHIRDGQTVFVLNKGSRFTNELEDAKKSWTMSVQQSTSITDAHAAILTVENVEPLAVIDDNGMGSTSHDG